MHLKSKETYLVTKRHLSIIYTHNLQVQVCKAGGQLPGPLQNIARLGRCENTRMERVAVHQSHDDPQVLARIVRGPDNLAAKVADDTRVADPAEHLRVDRSLLLN